MRTSSNLEVGAQENNGDQRENRDQNVTECGKWKSERILTTLRSHAGVGKKDQPDNWLVLSWIRKSILLTP